VEPTSEVDDAAGEQAEARPAYLDPQVLPKHIAIIMDGNGRWAKARGLPRVRGHQAGVRAVRAVVEESCRLGVQQLTLYCLSVENWKRPRLELDFLMKLLERYVVEERQEIMDQNIRLCTIGRREGLSAGALRELDKSMELSGQNTGMALCLAINYGGRSELVDAIRRIGREIEVSRLAPDQVDEAVVGAHLYTAGMTDPDLLIRTAGEMRVSNFLLWQLWYAEIWVTDTCWPDFGVPTLHQALRDYAGRERRFGGLNT